MTNPKTIDRRDVSPATNPVAGHDHIEDAEGTSLAKPLNPKAAKLPAGGSDAAVTGMPRGARNELPDAGMPHNVPPARSGQSADEAQPVAPDSSNSGRLDQNRVDGRETAHVQSPHPAD